MIPEVTWSCECGEVIKVSAEMAGKEYRCPNCRQFGWVPQPKAAKAKPKKVVKKPALKPPEPSAATTAAKGFLRSVFSLESIGGYLAIIGVIGLFALLNWWMLSYLWTR